MLTRGVRPQRLRPGDRVTVVAPAGPPDPDRLAAGERILAGWGLDVVRGAHVLDRHPTLDYLAGADADRAADLTAAWSDPGVAAVFCARGGDRAVAPGQQPHRAAAAGVPAPVVAGGGDAAGLRSPNGAVGGVVSACRPAAPPAVLAARPGRRGHLRRVLFAPEGELVLRGPLAETLVGGRAGGVTFGGNLSLLVSRGPLGYRPPSGAIALVEDVGEDPYKIDHLVTHLLQAGWFDQVAGIALGSWERCGQDLAAVRRVFEDRLGRLGVPVVWEHGFGHGRGQLTVPLGVHAELDADAGTLTLIEPALA